PAVRQQPAGGAHLAAPLAAGPRVAAEQRHRVPKLSFGLGRQAGADRPRRRGAPAAAEDRPGSPDPPQWLRPGAAQRPDRFPEHPDRRPDLLVEPADRPHGGHAAQRRTPQPFDSGERRQQETGDARAGPARQAAGGGSGPDDQRLHAARRSAEPVHQKPVRASRLQESEPASGIPGRYGRAAGEVRGDRDVPPRRTAPPRGRGGGAGRYAGSGGGSEEDHHDGDRNKEIRDVEDHRRARSGRPALRPRGEIWRRRPWIWVPALLFFLANAAAFSVYKLGYAGQVEKLDVDIHTQEQKRQELNAQYQQLQTMIARVRTNQEQVQQLYADRFSTRSRRLTTITQEVKDLARQAGLSPRAISYPEKEIQDYGLIKRSFNFSVQGPYSALRKLVSLLETSRSYIVIDELNVGSNTEGPELRIDLTLSTLFAMTAEDGAAAVPGAAETSAAAGKPAARPATPRPVAAGGDS